MPGRLLTLQKALNGYSQIGIHFVNNLEGQYIDTVAGLGDDYGLYYWGSLVGNFFNCSADQAAHYFFAVLSFFGFIIASTGFIVLSKTFFEKILSGATCFLAAYIAWTLNDVYVANFFACSFIPWCLIAFKKKNIYFISFYYFVSGFFFVEASFVRSTAFLAPLFFLLIKLLLEETLSLQKKALVLFCLLTGYSLSTIRIKTVFKNSQKFLQEHNGAYGNTEEKHVFWHSIYCGFGYLTNKYNIKYSDSCPQKLFENQREGVFCPSKKYEKAVKKGVFKFVKKNLDFVLQTLAAKVGVVLLYFLIFAGWGLLQCRAGFHRGLQFSVLKKVISCTPLFFIALLMSGFMELLPLSTAWKLFWMMVIGLIVLSFVPLIIFVYHKKEQLPWCGALFFAALPGIIVVPLPAYLLGFITCSIFYGLNLTIQNKEEESIDARTKTTVH